MLAMLAAAIALHAWLGNWIRSTEITLAIVACAFLLSLFRAHSSMERAILASIAGALVLASGALVTYQYATRVSITGTVECASHADIEGIYVLASSGGSNWASWQANIGGWRARFEYTLPNGGSYSIHVGCGGTPQIFATSNRSPLTSSTTVVIVCYDSVATARRAHAQLHACAIG
jgi:hypothetical protein